MAVIGQAQGQGVIAVDVNVIAYLFIESDQTEVAQRVFLKDPTWVVPELWKHEFLNILATYYRSGGAQIDDLLLLWGKAIPFMTARERPVSFPNALRLAAKFKMSAYDAQYVALAQDLSIPLITEDKELLTKFPKLACSMKGFTNTEGTFRGKGLQAGFSLDQWESIRDEIYKGRGG